jgi:hypothetical protein
VKQEVTRMKFLHSLRIAFGWFLLALALSSPAYAYVDPGSSLLLLQGLFAAFGAALTFFRKPWQMLAKLFSREKKTPDA